MKLYLPHIALAVCLSGMAAALVNLGVIIGLRMH
jgi:hypothetical protein